MRTKSVAPASALALLVGLAGLVHVLPRGPARGGAEGPGLLRPDLNRSPARHLVLLPGIGPVRARAIVEERARRGPFAGVRDVQRVRGIGPRIARDLEGAATAGGP